MTQSSSGDNPVFRLPERLLLGPGPSPVPARVLKAMATPPIGYLDPAWFEVMAHAQGQLRRIYNTNNARTLPISGTGTMGMQACVAALVEEGDNVVVGVNGYFGNRLVDMAERLGANVTQVENVWGRAIDAGALEAAIKKVNPKVVMLVHAETSTGVRQPMDDVTRIVRDAGVMLLTDCVTSLGGVAVQLDDWGVDAAYSCTQKCLGAPPGLAPVSFSRRAVRAVAERKSKIHSFNVDIDLIDGYWTNHAYHHTPPNNMLYALVEAMTIIEEEGLDNRIARHQQNHLALVAGLEAMGLSMNVPAGERLPSLNAVGIPEGADDGAVRGELLGRFGIEMGAGLGAGKGKVWRIGLMGHGSQRRNVLTILAALGTVLNHQGIACDASGAMTAAESAYG
jgi:alanine-glyoxylate transaminase/serine-glyoxylate transaminase/serine-pyruvate transaminase